MNKNFTEESCSSNDFFRFHSDLCGVISGETVINTWSSQAYGMKQKY